LKIAMLLSVAETNTLVVTDTHVARAIAVVEKLLGDFSKSMEWTTATAYGQQRMRMLELMKRRNGQVTRAEVMKNLAVRKDDMDLLQESLAEERIIEVKIGKGGLGVMYKFTEQYKKELAGEE